MGEGVGVLQAGWETVLENNKQSFTLNFVQRANFAAAFPTSMSPAQFVDQLFTNAGVTPTAAERSSIISEFGSATNTIDTAARARALRRAGENSTRAAQETKQPFWLFG